MNATIIIINKVMRARRLRLRKPCLFPLCFRLLRFLRPLFLPNVVLVVMVLVVAVCVSF